ncbi:MAG: hypothetical protein RMI91_11265 [Gemmatales bacterium]|nr:hypothetical protein [Gemmatales bacterium]MDW7995222.1 hypothetical protein [Gemmatales bacterium]
MSRMIQTWKRTNSQTYLIEEVFPHGATQPAPAPAQSECPTEHATTNANEDLAIPFVEIPEPAETTPTSTSENRSTQCVSLRFHSCLESKTSAREASNAWFAHRVESSQAWHSEVERFWQHISQARAHRLLLITALPPQTAPNAILTLAICLTRHATPLLLVEVSPQLSLHSQLQRAAAPGFSDWLAGLPLICTVQSTPLPGLHYLAPGHDLASTQRQLISLHDNEAWISLSRQYPLTLLVAPLDCPWAIPLALSTDAISLLAESSESHAMYDPRFLALQASAAKTIGILLLERCGSATG